MAGSSSWMPYAPQGVKGFDYDMTLACCVVRPRRITRWAAHVTRIG